MNEAPVETPGPFSWVEYRLKGLDGLDCISGLLPVAKQWGGGAARLRRDGGVLDPGQEISPGLKNPSTTSWSPSPPLRGREETKHRLNRLNGLNPSCASLRRAGQYRRTGKLGGLKGVRRGQGVDPARDLSGGLGAPVSPAPHKTSPAPPDTACAPPPAPSRPMSPACRLPEPAHAPDRGRGLRRHPR